LPVWLATSRVALDTSIPIYSHFTVIRCSLYNVFARVSENTVFMTKQLFGHMTDGHGDQRCESAFST
jgi:hypothetical protein